LDAVQPDEFPDLLRAAKAGDQDAFATLFRHCQPVMLRYLSSVAALDLVDDIASDAWVSVIRALDTFDDGLAGFTGWVLTMARRRWIDELRRRGRRHELLSIGESLPEIAAPTTVESEVEARLGGDAALALVRTLPPDQAEVVALRAISGLSVEEVARIVGKTPGSVRVLSHRGLHRLREKLRTDVTKPGDGSVEEVT
jgi:RNA polymerase sigma-70 factor (ECF subfamily)